MRRYKIVASILLIVPVINFALALPIIEEQGTRTDSDVLHDVAVTTQAKRGGEETMDKLWETFFDNSFRKSESSAANLPSGWTPKSDQHAPPQDPASSAVPDHGSIDLHQMETSETQQVSPVLSKSPTLNHYIQSPQIGASFSHYQKPIDAAPKLSSFLNIRPERVASSPVVQSKPKSFINKMFRKLKFWGPTPGSQASASGML